MLNLSIDLIISLAITMVIAFTVHEFAHAFAADRLGDSTPRNMGRLTLNPKVHIDPIGALLLIFAGFGWARPVQVNPLALTMRTRYGPMLVALAGPLSNLLMAIIGGILFRIGIPGWTVRIAEFLPTLQEFLWVFININLILMIFNMLPIPPLDGEKVLNFFLPENLKRIYAQIRPYGTTILLLLIMLGSVANLDLLSFIIEPLKNFFLELILLA